MAIDSQFAAQTSFQLLDACGRDIWDDNEVFVRMVTGGFDGVIKEIFFYERNNILVDMLSWQESLSVRFTDAGFCRCKYLHKNILDLLSILFLLIVSIWQTNFDL